MISRLRGKLIARNSDSVVLDIGGVGYRVRVPSNQVDALGADESPVELYTHLHVREDEMSLYGFQSEADLGLFELLLTVSGIGPKGALTILASAPVETIRLAIGQGNLDVLTGIPGIGKKTAQRLILELKNKVDLTGLEEGRVESPLDEEVVGALLNLGYSAAESRRAASSVPSNVKTLEERLRGALRYLGA